MARWFRCTVEELSVSVRAAEYAERIGAGKLVDFDRVILPATATAPALTFAHALGHRAETCFEPADVPAAAAFDGLPLDDDTNDDHADSPATPAQE
jgi:hypothetical protein